MAQAIDLRGRRGVEFGVLVMVMLPLILILWSVAIDGMAVAATAHRARGVAAVAAQTGAQRINFSGGRPSLASDACSAALANAVRNTNGGSRAILDCSTSGNRITVSASLKVPKMFGFSVWFPNYVTFSHTSEPQSGINVKE